MSDDDDEPPPPLVDDDSSGPDEDKLKGVAPKPLPSSTKAQKAEQHKDAGNALYKADKFVEALAEYTKGLDLHPTNAKLYSNRSICYEKLFQFENAHKDACKCVEYDPNFSRGYLRKGRAEERLTKYKESLKSYKEGKKVAISMRDSDAIVTEFVNAIGEVSVIYGKFLVNHNDLTKAKRVYEEALSENTSVCKSKHTSEIKNALQDVKTKIEAQNVAKDPNNPPQSPKRSPRGVQARGDSHMAAVCPSLHHEDEPPQVSQSSDAMAGLDENQAKLFEAETLTNLALDAHAEGRLVEALDKHDRASRLKVDVMGDSHSIVTINWDRMGYIFLSLGRDEEAFYYLDRAYSIRKKKKKTVDAELRWETGMLLAMVHKGGLRFQDAIELLTRCQEFYEKKYGVTHPKSIEAKDNKVACERLQDEKWWLVHVMNFTGEQAKFNGRKGRLFPAVDFIILMLTGEMITPQGQHNYTYVLDPDSDDVPPDLRNGRNGAHDKKGGQAAASNQSEDYALLRAIRAEFPMESAKFCLSEFQKRHPAIPSSLSRVKKVFKDLEAEDMPTQARRAELTAERDKVRQQILLSLKRGMAHPECAICFEPFSSVPEHEPWIIKQCGHTFCMVCANTAKRSLKCPSCQVEIVDKEPVVKNYLMAQLMETFDRVLAQIKVEG